MKQRKKILESYSRILFSYSKKNRFQESKRFMEQRFMEQPSFELHDIYRSLSVIAQESDYIQSRIFKNSTTIEKRNTQVIYYDCTNFYFEIDNEGDDKQFGKSKENRSLPIIGMGLFMDSDGIPISYSAPNTTVQTIYNPSLPPKNFYDIYRSMHLNQIWLYYTHLYRRYCSILPHHNHKISQNH